MNNFDVLARLIIPGIFVVIWLLNQLFNKEVNPPANRTPLGPRPGGLPPAPRPGERSTGGEPTMRFSSTSPPRRADDVVVIRAEPTRPSAVGGAAGRRQAR